MIVARGRSAGKLAPGTQRVERASGDDAGDIVCDIAMSLRVAGRHWGNVRVPGAGRVAARGLTLRRRPGREGENQRP
ncbi:hypothetical protein ebA6840 [Aromatoleum aromaticum EbN1]|uniref:Uncharacterized protein n=1 Tax=Aromatoleum aromaticum (strain DSM 19018 / LMG 30748 / EbN1) TaxID=76114 RepID=Q5NY32_AROAE|nr:hypothetical protein ebA6840 [Aromatoleum aromaticum EbN1]